MIKKMQLPLQTLNLVVGFMVWVIISSLLPFIQEDIQIPADKIAILTAIPVVLGSILRIPLGYYANVFGARIVFLVSFILLLFPVFYISEASSYIDLMIGGLFLLINGVMFESWSDIVWNGPFLFGLIFGVTIGMPAAYIIYYTLIML